VLVKASIDTTDKMMTTAGSLALGGNITPLDTFVTDFTSNLGNQLKKLFYGHRCLGDECNSHHLAQND
jgi:hypothetical protein